MNNILIFVADRKENRLVNCNLITYDFFIKNDISKIFRCEAKRRNKNDNYIINIIYNRYNDELLKILINSHFFRCEKDKFVRAFLIDEINVFITDNEKAIEFINERN